MGRKLIAAAGAAAVGATALAIGVLPGAADSGSDPQLGTAAATTTMPALTLGGAQRAARAALAECRRQGYPVTVVVLDRDGVDLTVLRDEDATGATVATARGKAYAAVGFQSPTSGLAAGIKDNPGLVTVPNFVLLAGGLPIKHGPDTIGGIGVSGAPTGTIDESCATVGLGAL